MPPAHRQLLRGSCRIGSLSRSRPRTPISRFVQTFSSHGRPASHLVGPRPCSSRFALGWHATARRPQWSIRPYSSHNDDSDENMRGDPLTLNLSDVFDAKEISALVRHTTSLWPRPENIPSGWSCEWELWAFFTLFWRSPYFLRLPQIKMIVNIQHRIPGEIEPIMYAKNSPGLFAFVANDEYFLAEYLPNSVTLFRLGPLETEEEFLAAVQSQKWRDNGRVPPDPDGETVLDRILTRDETVVTTLYEDGYLDYEPALTTEEEEQEDVLQRLLQTPETSFAAEEQNEEAAEVAEALEQFETYFKELDDLNPTQEEMEKDPELQWAMEVKTKLRDLKAAEEAEEATKAALLEARLQDEQEPWVETAEKFEKEPGPDRRDAPGDERVGIRAK